MESKDKEREFRKIIWETYRQEWKKANKEKRKELLSWMRKWQELMKYGVPASEAYHLAKEEDLSGDTRVWELSGKRSSRWPWAAIVTSTVLAISVILAVVYIIGLIQDNDDLARELVSVQSILASTQSELTSTRQILTSTQSELDFKEQSLTLAQSELNSTKQTLASTKSELSDVRKDLKTTENELKASEDKLATTEATLKLYEDTLGGLGITLSRSIECSDVTLIDNPNATDPTWSQLRAFLYQDQTEGHPYIEDIYDCSQFSRDIHNNAEAIGIRAAVVHVDFRNESTRHALNAFLTTDYGLVYFDCTGGLDVIARVKIRREYRAVEIYRITKDNIRDDYWWDTLKNYYYSESSTGDHSVTSGIMIYW